MLEEHITNMEKGLQISRLYTCTLCLDSVVDHPDCCGQSVSPSVGQLVGWSVSWLVGRSGRDHCTHVDNELRKLKLG